MSDVGTSTSQVLLFIPTVFFFLPTVFFFGTTTGTSTLFILSFNNTPGTSTSDATPKANFRAASCRAFCLLMKLFIVFMVFVVVSAVIFSAVTGFFFSIVFYFCPTAVTSTSDTSPIASIPAASCRHPKGKIKMIHMAIPTKTSQPSIGKAASRPPADLQTNPDTGSNTSHKTGKLDLSICYHRLDIFPLPIQNIPSLLHWLSPIPSPHAQARTGQSHTFKPFQRSPSTIPPW